MATSSSNDLWNSHLDSYLAELKCKGLLRYLRPAVPTLDSVKVNLPKAVYETWLAECNVKGLHVSPQTVPLKLFSLNDYMGMSTHPQVCLAAVKAAAAAGMGPRSSALVGGYTAEHQALESQLCALKETEDALLFPSGFAANQATIAVLGGAADCEIFSDELNHASIIDGIRLAKVSGAAVKVYRHNDMHHLRQLLQQSSPRKRKLVVTDSLFSMDGDFADLEGLARLRREFGFLLAIDEAHATLVCGKRGGGVAEAAGVSDQVDVHIGTLSKAIGSQGGFVACSRRMKSLLLNRGRPYVFSTALTLPTVAAASTAISVAEAESWRREHLWELVERLSTALGVVAESPIIPLIIGSENDALAAAGRLLLEGIHVPAIRPPTVPPTTSRLRVSLSAAHTTADVDALVAALGSSSFQRPSLPFWAKL